MLLRIQLDEHWQITALLVSKCCHTFHWKDSIGLCHRWAMKTISPGPVVGSRCARSLSIKLHAVASQKWSDRHSQAVVWFQFTHFLFLNPIQKCILYKAHLCVCLLLSDLTNGKFYVRSTFTWLVRGWKL